ncbi:hypothetical protein CEXT_7831 [Caerostris extrusa]|uniref:Uncharacterized protein n=1 Tax=Caerostris extrusa TaxID=172846 RepID=A0AAV4XHX7_CAEEX|nr:hypothetical protein CEXT_7831 [Caerostris extrusa]
MMNEMEISTEGNGPSEYQREVLSPTEMDSNQQTKETEKSPLRECADRYPQPSRKWMLLIPSLPSPKDRTCHRTMLK